MSFLRTYHYKPTERVLKAISILDFYGWSNKELSSLFNVSVRNIIRYKKRGYKLIGYVNGHISYKGERPKIVYTNPHKLEEIANDPRSMGGLDV